MGKKQIIKSVCMGCGAGCGILIHMENGRPIRIQGDRQCINNEGRLCMKGLSILKTVYHPDRLKHPLKRAGEKGSGKWHRISWNEALEIIAEKFTTIKDNYGAESVAMVFGSARGFQDNYLKRLASTFGTPNVATQSHVCYVPGVRASQVTSGSALTPDLDFSPACLVVWGEDMTETRVTQFQKVIRAKEEGTKLIVIDPVDTRLARKADLWVRIRPGSDLALALGMMNVIINEGLFDKDFVNTWTVGFDALSDHVRAYPPEKVAEITWIEADKIREAARLYAESRPSCIATGNGLELNLNSFQAYRGLFLLQAITGNIGVPGGQVGLYRPIARRHSHVLTLHDKIPPEQWEKRVGAELRLIPTFDYTVPQSVIHSILHGDPYLIRAVYFQACNPLVTYPNTQEVYKALNKVDFLAVSELFMTPTAELADIVLPAATYLEFENVVAATHSSLIQMQRKVVEIGECWPDYRIINRLAEKLGLHEYFGDDEEQFLDTLLEPGGLTFSEFKKLGTLPCVKEYRKHETTGFATPSGKVELYSERLKEWGCDPLPIYYELPETLYSAPELAREYPLIHTGTKILPYVHSNGRQIDTLRRMRPDPIVYIHPAAAKSLGVQQGDWVNIETERGTIKQKVALTDKIDQRVVVVDYGWWFPQNGNMGSLEWAESNVNMLTNDQPPYNREMGSTNLRGGFCKVYPNSQKTLDE